MNRKPILLLIVTLLASLALAAALGGSATPARAAFPGQNGKIIFSRAGDNGGLHTIDADGQHEVRLGINGDNPAWSPDGKRIAFCRWHWTGAESTPDIYVADADGSNERRLTTSDAYECGPRWSPDGAQIVYDRSVTGGYEIWMMDADGAHQRELTTGLLDHSPDWSPDGKLIVFISLRYGTRELFVVSPDDGSNASRLTFNNTSELDPVWSPDGTRIAFMGVWDNDWEIAVMNADGSDVTRLTYNPGDDEAPAWSPDGARIAYRRDQRIYVMNADGSNPTPYTSPATWDSAPDWQPVVDVTTFVPTNDAYVLSSQRNTVFNRRRLLVRDAATDSNSYVKFNVSSLSGTLVRATLRLWVSDPGPDGGQVYAVSPFYKGTTTLWLETGLKWKNAPVIAGAPLDTAGKVYQGRWVTFDVTDAVAAGLSGNGRVSLALTNDSRNQVAYASKESAHSPELVIVTR